MLDWLEDDLELGEYRREFARAKVDGALLLKLEEKDLQHMLGMAHPLHRRRVCLGIQKMKDTETEEVRGTRIGRVAASCSKLNSTLRVEYQQTERERVPCKDFVMTVNSGKELDFAVEEIKMCSKMAGQPSQFTL